MRVAGILVGAGMLAGCSLVPEAITPQELGEIARDRIERATAGQEAVQGPIDMYEAMARALKYNLDHRVELQEEVLRVQELNLSTFDLLPDLVAGYNFNARDGFNSSRSQQVADPNGNFSPAPLDGGVFSRSSGREDFDSNLELSWDILDFGLSYYRAKQNANRAMIALEGRRRVANRIIEDVRSAYWRAISSQRVIAELRGLEERTETAFKNSRLIEQRRVVSPITALTFQRELISIKREAQELVRELLIAKSQLAALMNLPPDADFELVVPETRETRVEFALTPEEMIQVAFENRPELREVTYEQRINAQETRVALLELLPNFKAVAAVNFDSNQFLLNNNWVSWGARASWNLLNLISYPARERSIEAEAELLDAKALSVGMAVMTQVYVSRVRFENLLSEFESSETLLGVQRRLLEQIRSGYQARRISEQTLIREEMNTLVAEIRYDIAYASLQSAFANVYASLGLDSYDGRLTGRETVQDLATGLREMWRRRGDFGTRGAS
jgi:outer membrane protein TolC